jgi:hypothetical protein
MAHVVLAERAGRFDEAQQAFRLLVVVRENVPRAHAGQPGRSPKSRRCVKARALSQIPVLQIPVARAGGLS